jgi:hypothetical protein
MRRLDRLFQNPQHHQEKKKNKSILGQEMRLKIQLFSRGLLELSNSKPRYAEVSVSQIFTTLKNIFKQGLPQTELIHISAFYSFEFQYQTLFHCCEANRTLKLSRNSRTAENNLGI